MAFPKAKGSSSGLSPKMGSVVAEDEKSNIKGKGGQRIGTEKGRLSFSKSSVSGLNGGVQTCRDGKC